MHAGTEQELAACRKLVASLQQRIEDHESSLDLLTAKLTKQLSNSVSDQVTDTIRETMMPQVDAQIRKQLEALKQDEKVEQALIDQEKKWRKKIDDLQ